MNENTTLLNNFNSALFWKLTTKVNVTQNTKLPSDPVVRISCHKKHDRKTSSDQMTQET